MQIRNFSGKIEDYRSDRLKTERRKVVRNDADFERCVRPERIWNLQCELSFSQM